MKTSQSIVAALIMLTSATAANAVILLEGSTESLPGTTVASEPNLAGTVLKDDSINFSFASAGGNTSGSVQVRVVRSVDTTLDFYWRVFNDSSSDDAIGAFRLGDFYTSQYNANYRIDGLGDDAPDTAQRFSGTQSSLVNFHFDGGLAAGDSSKFFFLDTDATSYAKTARFDLATQNGISATYSMYAPATQVSEPASALMIGAGLLGLCLRRKRRSA